MSDFVIEVEDVTKTYRMGDVEVHALRGVSLRIARGEFVAIMGASGSGKSTLMNLLGCLDRPTRGTYLLEGVDVGDADEASLAKVRSRRIGFVFQSFNLLARTSAAENVALPLLYSGRLAESAALAREALRALGLTGREQSHPSQLSGGQQQRVAIARALINDPAILLADEPTAALDWHHGEEVVRLLVEQARSEGAMLLTVTHDTRLLPMFGRVFRIEGGLLSEEGRA